MDFRRKFEFGLAWRTALLVACVWLFIEALDAPDLRAARIVAALIAAFALWSLWEFIRRTNFQVSRFVESVRFEDYSQRFSDPSGGGFAAAIFVLCLFVLFAGYDVAFEVLNSGRTPGKSLNGLRVVRESGAPVTFGASAVRNVLRLVDFLPGWYLVGII